MKRAKLFARVIYYVLTFGLGIILAFVLPFVYMYLGVSLDLIAESLETGQYAEAMKLVGGYYNSQPVLDQKFDDGGGIVLFESATVYEHQVTDNKGALVIVKDKPVVIEKLHLAYAGFVYGVFDTYNIYSTQNNQTKVIVTDMDGNTHNVKILDYTVDDNDTMDSNSTVDQKGFFYLDIDKDTFRSVKTIQLIDKDGNVFKTITVNKTYDEAFFADVEGFIASYNDFITTYGNVIGGLDKVTTTEQLNAISDDLTVLDGQFLAKNQQYQKSNSDHAQKIADKKAAVVVVIYFVGIYVLGDFLLGNLYIVKGVKWVLVRVFKVKFKQKAKPKTEETFGSDYFSTVTVTLDVGDVANFDQSVQISYNNQQGEASFLLMKQNDYTVTKRIKAGTYVNLHADIDREKYTLQYLPETLVVEGYKKAFMVKLLKREE